MENCSHPSKDPKSAPYFPLSPETRNPRDFWPFDLQIKGPEAAMSPNRSPQPLSPPPRACRAGSAPPQPGEAHLEPPPPELHELHAEGRCRTAGVHRLPQVTSPHLPFLL